MLPRRKNRFGSRRSAGIAVLMVLMMAMGIVVVPSLPSAATNADATVSTPAAPGWQTILLAGGDTFIGESCPSANNCGVLGSYGSNPNPNSTGDFVLPEVNGKWGSPIDILLPTSLQAAAVDAATNLPVCDGTGPSAPARCISAGNGTATFGAISCDSSGQCLIGGTGGPPAELIGCEVRDCEDVGNWSFPLAVVGTLLGSGWQNADTTSITPSDYLADGVTPAIDGTGGITHISCSNAGHCLASGTYYGPNSDYEAFETVFALNSNLTGDVSGLMAPSATTNLLESAGLNQPLGSSGGQDNQGNAAITATDCVDTAYSKYLCGVVATTADQSSNGTPYNQAFALTLVNGSWGTPVLSQPLQAGNPDDGNWNGNVNCGGQGSDAGCSSVLTTVSCASDGSCGAGGQYQDSAGHLEAYVATKTVAGTWSTAVLAQSLNTQNNAVVDAISCPAANACVAGGSYTLGRRQVEQAFVATQTPTGWTVVPDVEGLNVGGEAAITNVGCVLAGHCVLGGNYSDPYGGQAFVQTLRGANLSSATPQDVALNTGYNATTTDIECYAAADSCAETGTYQPTSGAFSDGNLYFQWTFPNV
jgi:hypothetical protein